MRIQNIALCTILITITNFILTTEANRLRKVEKDDAALFYDEVEQEVMGLWKRMLQLSIPTFSPTSEPTFSPTPAETTIPQGEECFLGLDVECYTLFNGVRIPCDMVTPVSSSNECSKAVQFEYIVSNTCNQSEVPADTVCTDAIVTSLITDVDGDMTDLTSSFPNQGVVPLSSLSYIEETTLDFCTARLVNVTTSIIANTTGLLGIPNICAADNITTVQINTNCEVQVQTSCSVFVNGLNVACDDMATSPDLAQCVYDATYKYIVTNIGAVGQDIIKLERTRGVSTLDLTTSLMKTSLAAGESTNAAEAFVPIDFCSASPFVTTVSVEAVPVSIGIAAPICSGTNSSLIQPTPKCEIALSLKCTTLLNGSLFACDKIPPPTESTGCNFPLAYSYNVTNIGVTNNSLTTLTRTRNGVTSDILDLTRRTSLNPGESTVVLEIVDTDFCQEGIVTTTSTVEAIPGPNGSTCSADADVEFPINIACSVELNVECYADSKRDFSVRCEDFYPFDRYNKCEFPINYIFTVTNSGPVTEQVSSLESVIMDGLTVELLDEPFLLYPGEVKVIEKSTSTDFCRVEGEILSHAVVTANAYPNGDDCTSKAQHVFTPPGPPCNVTLDRHVECTIADSDISCVQYIASITDFSDPEQCMVDVDFTFSLFNQGLACLDIQNITNIADHIDTRPADITVPDDISFCPGDDLTVTRMKNIDICQQIGKKLDFTVQVNGERPEVCGGFGILELLASLRTCSIDLDVTCHTPEGNYPCQLPPKIQCDIHNPCFIDLEYTGGKCSMSYNSQSTYFFCQDYHSLSSDSSSSPFFPFSSVYIVVTSSSSGKHDSYETYFSGTVAHGTRFRIGQKGDHPALSDNIHVLIYDVKGGTLIQKLKMHTSCSDKCPLYTAESFGSLAVVGFGNIHKEVLLPEFHYLFQYTVENIGKHLVGLDNITLVAEVDKLPKDVLTLDLSESSDTKLFTNESFSDTVSFYLPPIHHYELNVFASVIGRALPQFFRNETCESDARLVLYPPCHKIQCNQCPFTLYLEYTGESCAQSSNHQSHISCTEKSSIENPGLLEKAFVQVTSSDFSKTYYSGFVKVGDVMEAKVPNYHYGLVLDETVVVKVKSYGGSLAQMIKFTTTCLDPHNPLYVGDTFGAVKVLGWHNKYQGVVKDDPSYHYPCS